MTRWSRPRRSRSSPIICAPARISSLPAPSTRSCRSRTATARSSGRRSTPSCRARRCSSKVRRRYLRRLQCLQVLDQFVPLTFLQLAADDAFLVQARRALERMAGHAVAVDRCSVGPCGRKQRFSLVATVGLLGIYAKTDLLRIEIAGTHAEFL